MSEVLIDSRPARFQEVPYYPGNPLVLRFFFHVSGGLLPLDMTGSTFEVRSFNQNNPVLPDPQLDTSGLNGGVLRASFSGSQTAGLPTLSHVSVSETSRWNRTVLIGRLSKDYVGYYPPTLDDFSEVEIDVAVVNEMPTNHATWATLGTIIWQNLGTAEWETI